jgi:tetratricopeptide (TPR) repeat protein
MPRNRLMPLFLVLAVATVALSGCANVDQSANKSPAAANTETSTAGKIPVTTSSDEARKEFLQGRDLNEKLLIQDSIQHFDKAISLDPNFAWAELSRALVSPTGKEFFEHLKKAVSLADKASNGEKLLILGTEAGANGNAAKQKEYFEQLASAYPNDERANFALAGYYFGQQDFPQLGVAPRGEEIGIFIKDNGRGISAEDLPHIFDRFYRGSSGAVGDADQAGVGMGLYLARGLVDQLGGRIAIESEVGRGSTFTLYLSRWYGQVEQEPSEEIEDVEAVARS